MKAVNKILRLFSIITLTFLITNFANSIEVRGVATETVESTIFSKKKTLAAIERAIPKACKNAFKKFIQLQLNDSERMIFESIQDQIYNNLNEYMICNKRVVPLDLSAFLSDKIEKKKIQTTKQVKVD